MALRIFIMLVALSAVGQANTAKKPDFEKLFQGLDGCFELYDLKRQQFVSRYNEARCAKRFPACSTFKWPLALMAFDAGVIADENTVFKWDGKKHSIEQWNRDQTAASWVANSVVWVSQEVTPKLGEARVRKYLSSFSYGSQDMSGGLTTAWLTTEGTNRATLQISADEQIRFLEKVWTGQLPVTPRALELTKKVTFLERTPKGYALHGKTGSGFTGAKGDLRLGWFIAHLQKENEEYAAVVTFHEKTHRENYDGYAGFEARNKMKAILGQLGLW